MNEDHHATQAFKLKGRLYTLTVLQVISSKLLDFAEQLDETITQAPKLFENAPVVLDFSLLSHQEINLQEMCRIIREQGIIPVAVQGADPLLETLAQCQGLAVLKSSATQDRCIEIDIAEKKEVFNPPAKIVTQPVRSGQQIVAKNSDLIITSSVSHGAELLADGNIHVYGALRGRALAGISGNTEARIFCRSLDAELISIAGYYRLSDAIEAQKGACQVFLDNEQIQIATL